MPFDWFTLLERFGFPVAMAVWMLVESRASRKSLEQREARYQAEAAKRVADAAAQAALREADMTKRIRELEESRIAEVKAANERFAASMQAVSDSFQDFAGQDVDLHRSVRRLHNYLITALPPPPGVVPPAADTEATYNPATVVRPPNGEVRDAATKRRHPSSATLQARQSPEERAP